MEHGVYITVPLGRSSGRITGTKLLAAPVLSGLAGAALVVVSAAAPGHVFITSKHWENTPTKAGRHQGCYHGHLGQHSLDSVHDLLIIESCSAKIITRPYQSL